MREVVLDTETTGLDPLQGDRVVELGCIEIVNFIPTGRHWHSYFNPEREVPEEALKVHGLTSTFLQDKPPFAARADDFLAFIEDAPLVIHNAAFDIAFVNAELARLGRPPIGMERVVDTLALARRKHPGAANSLDALCRRYRIDLAARDKHGALIDCELLACVYGELTGRRQALLELAADGGVPASQDMSAPRLYARPVPLAPRLSAEEVAAHDAFVRGLGDKALWLRRPAG